MSDKRSVSTDALATLGTIIQDGSRDAIHLAVEPVIAGEPLTAGQDIGLVDGKAYAVTRHTTNIKALGIVDPFLLQNVREGEKFWLIVYPRQITSLRHVWSHPDFSESELITAPRKPDIESEVESAQRWITEFAEKLGFSYTRLMEYADSIANGAEDYIYDNSETYKDHWDTFPEFWAKYEIIRGPIEGHISKDCFFTCSC